MFDGKEYFNLILRYRQHFVSFGFGVSVVLSTRVLYLKGAAIDMVKWRIYGSYRQHLDIKGSTFTE